MSQINYLSTMAQRIHYARRYAGMTQKELAKAADVSQNYISDIEHDQTKVTTLVAAKIAKALGVSLDYLEPEMKINDPVPYNIGESTIEAEMARAIVDALPIGERKRILDVIKLLSSHHEERS